MEQRQAIATLVSPAKNERDKDIERKRDDRSEAARIVIPECKNPIRRERCLADPERFLRTYFARQYRLSFGADHLFMIDTVVSRGRHGGRQAVAAPRGRGKSEIVKGLMVYLVCAQLVRFILPVAATTPLAKRLYRDFRKKLATNDMLYEDYPEICHPIRALSGAPLRAAKQHVDGFLTNIVWTDDYISLPNVPGSPYGGVKMAYYGLDAAFRGANIDGDRPDFVLVDDPETRESAKSHMQIEDREQILDQDISGLASQEEHLAIVVLTTVQNNFCLSASLTDPKSKPAYNGKRFGMVLSWPTNPDLWQTYISLRHESQIEGDEHGTKAVDHYEANRTLMDEGVKTISGHFKPIEVNGRQMVVSAIQQAYNQIADTSKDAYFTEYQNDPPASTGPQGQGLTAELVASRLSGFARRQLPANTIALTAAIDLGKYRCHWAVVAWWTGGGGCVVDYGVAEVTGTDKAIDNEASEPMIYRALLNWRDELTSKLYVDATGTNRRIDFCLVDSGTFTTAAYEFCRQAGGVFHPSKGINPYHPRKKSSATCLASANLHAQKFDHENIWLYELDTNHWKQFVHERFLTPPMDENNMLRRGSLSLFELDGYEKHGSYAQHIAAEELLKEFKEGKGVRTYWNAKNENNHWLDATYMAAAASEVCGIKLIGGPEVSVEARHVDIDKPKPRMQANPRQHGNGRFRSRPGGWVPKRR